MAEAHERLPEQRDVSPRAMLLFAGGFILFLAATLVLMAVIFGTASFRPRLGEAGRGNDVSPALQRTPAQDLARHRAEEEKSLHTLGWVDRGKGIARIPIEDAMQIVASHGLPEWGGKTEGGTGECAVLTANVPRAPQAKDCAPAKSGAGGAKP
ncbi:MAG: hypothetical protein ACTHLC_12820 [Rhizobiaceae bacterium]|jgi:hypothetical protein